MPDIDDLIDFVENVIDFTEDVMRSYDAWELNARQQLHTTQEVREQRAEIRRERKKLYPTSKYTSLRGLARKRYMVWSSMQKLLQAVQDFPYPEEPKKDILERVWQLANCLETHTPKAPDADEV
jgi:hypothetical protein